MLLKKTTPSPLTGKLSENSLESIDFSIALIYLKNGAYLGRKGWNEENSYVYLKKNILLHNKPYYSYQPKYLGGYPYIFSPEDVFGSDWIIIKYADWIK